MSEPDPAAQDHARTLVASYCFPPYSDTAGIVAAKRVRERGEPVDVIANAMDSIRQQDSSLTQIGGDLVRRFTALRTPSAFSSWRSISTYAERGYDVALRWEAEQGRYERVYSRAQFAASHFLGGRYKHARPETTWVAEFSDPLSHDVLGAARVAPVGDDRLAEMVPSWVESAGFALPDNENMNEWCEVVTFALADRIIFTNELQRDFMLERCHDPRLARRAAEVSVVSPHPTLPRSYYGLVRSQYAVDPDRVNIGYFGNFYANRGVGLLLDALAGLPRGLRDRLLVHVFTSKVDELAESVGDAGLADVVRVNPYVPYLEFLNLADRMDVLLVNDAVTPPGGTVNPFLPSKWSDYRGSSTPVWAIVEEGSSLSRMEGIRFRSPVEHLSALQQVLAELATSESAAVPVS